MVQFINLCVVFVLAYAAIDPVASYEYDRNVDAFLRLHTTPASFENASNRCQREGGVLMSPINDAEIQAIKRMLPEYKLTRSVLTGHHAKGNSRSVFGSANVAWSEGQANDDDECVALSGAGTASRVSCSSTHPYFCRKEASVKCGPIGNGYEYYPRTGSCYRFHRIALSWRSALASCHLEGAHLAIINSAMESSVLREIYAQNPNEVITGSGDPKYANVGFRMFEDGLWGTIHGETIAEAGFTQWSNGEPNNNGGEYCGSIRRDGLYNDLHCTYAFPYFCEKTPKIYT